MAAPSAFAKQLDEREQFNLRADDLRAEFIAFSDDMAPGAVLDERTASIAALFVAFKLDGHTA